LNLESLKVRIEMREFEIMIFEFQEYMNDCLEFEFKEWTSEIFTFLDVMIFLKTEQFGSTWFNTDIVFFIENDLLIQPIIWFLSNLIMWFDHWIDNLISSQVQWLFVEILNFVLKK
jgi:hypothetical protein